MVKLTRFLYLLLLLSSDIALAQNNETQNQNAAATEATESVDTVGTTEKKTDSEAEAEIEDSMADIKLIQQAMENLRREIEASKETVNLNRSSVETVRDGFKLIEDKLQDTYNKLDESRSSISANVENLDKLKEGLETISRTTRTNAAELSSQKSLIEDNAIRLYELLIQTSLVDEKTTGLYSVIEQNKESEQSAELQLATDADLASLRTLVSTVIVFFAPLAFILAGRANENRRLADGMNQQQAALPVCLIGAVGYMILGFGLMYGTTLSGWLGTSSYLFGSETDDVALVPGVAFTDFQLYQNGFVILASLIVYTIVGRQLSSVAHAALALFVGAVLIPVFGHWIWAGNFVAGNKGWLETMGFIDQAGSSVIHLVAAVFALTIAGKLGNTLPSPQPLQTGPAAAEIPVYSATAVIFLWLSWLGLTTGHLPISGGQIGDVLLNVNLAATAGGIMAFLYHVFFSAERSDMSSGLSGFVSGLVAIAASAAAVSAVEAIVIGAAAGFLQNIACGFLRKYFLAKPWQTWAVYLVAIHGAGGIWGTVCVALFATEGNFSAPDITQLMTQLQGVGIAIVYSVIMANIVLYLLRIRHKAVSSGA